MHWSNGPRSGSNGHPVVANVPDPRSAAAACAAELAPAACPSQPCAIAAGALALRDDLVRSLYADLRRIAAGYLRKERPGVTLQPTALVHEVFVKIASGRTAGWASPSEFFAAACHIMRQVLVDRARARLAQKRGGGGRDQSPSVARPMSEILESTPAPEHDEIDLEALQSLLNELEALSPRHAQIVQLRFFLGLSVADAAAALGLSKTACECDWRTARAWLAGRLPAKGLAAKGLAGVVAR